MKNIYLKICLLTACFLFALTTWGQTRKIIGKVTANDTGEELPGVSIIIKGKTVGTITNEKGDFTLAVDEGDILIVSYVGYLKEEISISKSSTVSIKLKNDITALGEVVVIGYGTQSRRNITSSIGKINKDILANSPRANVGTALQGSLAGLQVVNRSGTPGAAPSILLRGGASINTPGSPLVVVDGVIRALNDIAPDDIESIELLKDAASTAIYGARANNGVILITTKQGKAGTARVSYKFTTGFNKNREGYKYMNARDYIYYNRLGNLNSGRTLAQVNSSRGYGLLTDAANLALFDIRVNNAANAGLLSQEWQAMDDPYGGSILYKDHSGEIENLVFRNTTTQDHYLSVEGGNDKGKYFASFDHYNEDGVIVGSDYKRYTGNINGSYRVKPNLEITTGATFSTSSQNGTLASESNVLYRSLAIWPTMNPWLDSLKTMPNPGNSISDGNPLYWLQKTKRNSEVNRITVNASAKYDITKDLYVKVSGNAYLFESLNQSFNLATQTYTNLYTNPPSFSNATRASTALFSRSVQQQYNAIINYQKELGDFHHINAMLGAELFGQKSFEMQVSGQNAPTDDIETANASTTFAAGSNYSFRDEYKILSQFGRLNYDFDERYLLSLVIRRDGVSSLADENRYGIFPGMSAGWNLHKEKFFQESFLNNYVSALKPRFSYGFNGNVAGIGNYEVQGVYGSQGNYNGSLGFLSTNIINSGLRWEKSKTLDVGLDISLLKNRLNILFDYYDRRTSDLLTNLTLPSYVGYSSVRTNLGTFQNKGIEVTVNATILKSPNGLTWNLGGNVSFTSNKILQLPYNGNENNRQGGLQIYDPTQGKVVWVGGLQEGQPLGAIYGFKQVSIFKNEEEIAKIAANRVDNIAGIGGPSTSMANKITPGDVNWLDVDKNDIIDSRDQVYLGNITPNITGGFTSSISFKEFSLFTRFDFALGHTIYNDLVARTLGNYQGTFNYIELQKEAWSPTNTDTNIPKVYYADQVGAPAGKKNYTRANNGGQVLNGNNSQFYEKGDYLACREITISYDLSKYRLLTKWFSQARVYANFNNLFYITKFSGPSPEPPTGGIYSGTYPTPKSVVLGVQVSF
ncbi:MULTISPECIES: TonB-dependent receptor [unclassified Arcicella]|uniref:SusC/RagA family TonB-linked outer membrane protein n=1 Tax=unclassified Arcicella TaxID=2644986 RepID=UPI00286760C6|nr:MULTISPECIES: TonB-dependent receptor [unclassified Arcicella]MDR6562477.1 TonB-linked SusC/RagA family outer membrane protein [Arcicella sp. BE51]MDR6812210.1 TonB-linked SusC/RagA family outer membrane protein [Arcicella sp. BE140]MDR6823541.1 TonB-linked SusC/RagA family outer membrane protein [Arcicella sp. BE139]